MLLTGVLSSALIYSCLKNDPETLPEALPVTTNTGTTATADREPDAGCNCQYMVESVVPEVNTVLLYTDGYSCGGSQRLLTFSSGCQGIDQLNEYKSFNCTPTNGTIYTLNFRSWQQGTDDNPCGLVYAYPQVLGTIKIRCNHTPTDVNPSVWTTATVPIYDPAGGGTWGKRNFQILSSANGCYANFPD